MDLAEWEVAPRSSKLMLEEMEKIRGPGGGISGGLEKVDFFQRLPRDFRLEVFGFLDDLALVRCMRVCKDWKELLSESSMVWRKLVSSLVGLYCVLDFFSSHDHFVGRWVEENYLLATAKLGEINWITVCEKVMKNWRYTDTE